MEQCNLSLGSVNLMRNVGQHGNLNIAWGFQGNEQREKAWRAQGSCLSNMNQEFIGFGNQCTRQEEKKSVFEEVLLNKMEEMQMDMKAILFTMRKSMKRLQKGWIHMKRR